MQSAATPPETASELKPLIADTSKAVIVEARATGDKTLEALAIPASRIDSSTNVTEVVLRTQQLVTQMNQQFPPGAANGGNPIPPAAVAKP